MGRRKSIGRKMGSTAGASMALALGVLLAVSLLCASLLKIVSDAPKRAVAVQEQAYLSSVSAAKLLKAVFAGTLPGGADSRPLQAARDLLREVDNSNVRDASGHPYMVWRIRLDSSAPGAAKTALDAVVTLTGGGSFVTAETGGADGYPIRLSFPVYAVSLVSIRSGGEEEEESALRTYPLGYPRADAEAELLDTALEPGADDYYFRYYHWRETADEPDAPDGTPLTVRPWKIEWLDYDDSVRARVFLGTGTPPEEEVHPGEGIAPLQEDPALIYAFTGWNWAEREVHEETRIVTVSPVYTSKPRRRIVWLNGDGTELSSADYGQGDEAPAAPAVPEKASEYPAYFRYAGSWTVSGTYSDEYGVPITAMKPVYSTVAERRYTVRWLEFDADAAEEVDRKTAVPGQTEPVTGKIPVMTDADSFYPFTGWGGWTMDTASGVKTYVPAFSDYGEPLHTITWVWKGANGSSQRKSIYYGNAAPSAVELAALTPDAAYQRGDEVHDTYTWDITTDGSTTTYTAVYPPLEGGNG